MEVRELLTKYKFGGDDAPVVRVSALKALQGDPKWVKSIQDLVAAVDEAIPGAGARRRQAVLDGRRRRVLDQGPRHRRDGSYRARQGARERRSRDPRLPRSAQDVGDRRRDVPQAARRGPGWRQRRLPLARHREGRHRARSGAREARLDQDAQEVRRRGLRPQEGGGRPSQAVLHELPPAVLHAHDRRDGHHHAPGRREDGDAGRQREDDGRADHAGRARSSSSASPSAKAARPSAPAS